MTENGLSVLSNGVELQPINKEGKLWFTADELGKALRYANPAHAVNKIFRQNQNELKHYSVRTKTVSTDGKYYETRAFSREGALIVSMLARTNQAKKVRAWLTKLGDQVIEETLRRGRLAGHEAAFGFDQEAKGHHETGAQIPPHGA